MQAGFNANASSAEDGEAAEYLYRGPAHVVLMGTILGLALLGNAGICWIVANDQRLRSCPNHLVLNLAACGLFTVAANGPPVLLALAAPGWRLGEPACRLNGFTTSVYGLASVLTMAVISVNRYQLVRRSTGQRVSTWFTRSTVRFLIAGVWIFSALIAFPPVVGWSHYEYIPERAICTLKWSTEISYTVFVFGVGIFLPFVVIFAAYLAIFCLVRHKFKRMRECMARRPPQRDQGPSVSHSTGNYNISDACNLGHLAHPAEHHWGSHRQQQLQQLQQQQDKHQSNQQDQRQQKQQQHKPSLSRVSERSSDMREEIPAAWARSSWHLGAVASPEGNVAVGLRDHAAASRSWLASEAERRPHTDQVAGTGWAETDKTASRGPHRLNPMRAASMTRGRTQARPKSAHSPICRVSSAPGRSPRRESCHGQRRHRSTGTKSSVTNAALLLLPARDDIRVTVMVLAVLTSFVLCWSPVTIINLAESVWGLDVAPALNVFSVYMVFASSAVHPLIYGLLNRNYRNGFRRLLRRLCSRLCGGGAVTGRCGCPNHVGDDRQNRISAINLNHDATQ